MSLKRKNFTPHAAREGFRALFSGWLTYGLVLPFLFLGQVSATDTDADGLDDSWELQHFVDLAQDASGDPDGDGYSNLEEQNFGLDPNLAGGLPGYLSHDAWYDIPGITANDLQSSEKFRQSPDLQELVLGAENSLGADNFGSRYRGTLLAPISGSYTFWISGDNGVELWLSSDESKFNRRRIAWHELSSGVQQWDRFSSQQSAPISLVAGQKYYLEVFHKENTGDDHVSIAWSYEADDFINLARNPNAVATQSSTRADGGPARAIDGNYDGNFAFRSVTHTSDEENSWWQVDLGGDFEVQQVVLFNRTGGDAPRRLSNFRVSVLDVAGNEVFGRDYFTLEGHVQEHLVVGLEAPVLGRTVRVSLLGNNLFGDGVLSLAEVEVMSSASGEPNATPLGYLTNWTQEAGVAATQSSTGFGAEASRAIDGNRDGSFFNGSVTHTRDEEGSWWEVDLGVERSVMRVGVYNRTGGAQIRLSNYRITALDSAGVELAHEDFYVEEGFAPCFSKWDLPVGISARKVRVELLGPNRADDYVLSLAEVEVLGSEIILTDEIQGQEVIPVGVLESYVLDPSDPDDDYLPSEWEILYGLDPNNAQDTLGGAFGDPDGDLISNWQECQIGSDPLVANSFPGALTEEFWFGVEGQRLEDLYTNSAFLEGPDIRRFIFQSEGSRWVGSNTGTRIRGFLTAPQTGDYFFWLSGDDEVRFWLSSDDDKFNKEQLINPHLYVDYQNYDIEASQKSRVVSLVEGETYYVEMQWKEANGGGDSPVSLAWQAPGGQRELIPSEYFSSYNGHPNDVDDDGLPDDWEVANGLDSSDNGFVNPANGFAGDLDGDGLTNFEEFAANTRADLSDSDGDGIDDYQEVNVLKTNALVGDVAPFQLESTLNGSSFVAQHGEWRIDENRAASNSVRGWVDYEINLSSDGIYLLEADVSSGLSGSLSDEYRFIFSIDGIEHEKVDITMAADESGTASTLTPWLEAGTHTIRIFNDNALTFRRIFIDSLRVLSSQGSDLSGNGVPDWVDFQVGERNEIETNHVTSKVSPVQIKGRTEYFDLLALSGGLEASQFGDSGWSVDLPLTESGSTTLTAVFENGASAESLPVTWEVTNLLEQTSLMLRQGDSLKLTAFTGTTANGSDKVWLTIDGVTHYFKGNQPMVYQFDTVGNQIIDIVHRRGNGNKASETNHQVTVNVVAPISITSPVMMPTHVREWTVPALPAGAVLEFDEQMEVREAIPQADGSTRYVMVTNSREDLVAQVRMPDGTILQSIPIRNLRVWDAENTSVIFVQNFGDGSYQVDMPVVISSIYEDVVVNYNIFIAGVMFDTGGIDKDYLSTDFDDFGQGLVTFIKMGTSGSACHRTSVFQDGVRIGHFF